MKKNSIIVLSIIAISVICIIILFFIVNRDKEPGFTGGSGVPDKGYLVLRGYETKSNNNPDMSLGTYLTIGQQQKIRSFLEVQLFEIKNQAEYIGNVVPGSVEVDYSKSTVTFDVEIEDPETSYTVSINTINDDMKVTNEDGEILLPPNQ